MKTLLVSFILFSSSTLLAQTSTSAGPASRASAESTAASKPSEQQTRVEMNAQDSLISDTKDEAFFPNPYVTGLAGLGGSLLGGAAFWGLFTAALALPNDNARTLLVGSAIVAAPIITGGVTWVGAAGYSTGIKATIVGSTVASYYLGGVLGAVTGPLVLLAFVSVIPDDRSTPTEAVLVLGAASVGIGWGLGTIVGSGVGALGSAWVAQRLIDTDVE